jgi:hypothetical protein
MIQLFLPVILAEGPGIFSKKFEALYLRAEPASGWARLGAEEPFFNYPFSMELISSQTVFLA